MQKNDTLVLVFSLILTGGIISTVLWGFTPHPEPTIPPPPLPTPTKNFYQTFAEVPNVPQMKVRYGGSTTFAPLRSPAIEAQIRQAHPGFALSYIEPLSRKPGSGTGIQMLLEGQLSFSQSSRDVKVEEYDEAQKRGFHLEQIPVAIDGIALYVNRQLSIPGLTLAQVKDIYTGKITNWQQVGGPDLEITPFSRPPQDGGTPEYFKDKVLGQESFASGVNTDVRDTTTSIRNVASTPGGIGYATASEVIHQTTIQPLAIARQANFFVSPCADKTCQGVNKKALADGSYPITRRLFIVVKHDNTLDEQAGLAYSRLILSDEGQRLVEQAGFVPIR